MTSRILLAFFDAKPYDRHFFDAACPTDVQIRYFETRLTPETSALAEGCQVVCAFVNDSLSREVIEALKPAGVELLAMRCAGYNNVDLKAAFGSMPVVRVPEYSPHAVAEYTVALMLSLNRKTHKAYHRTRDGNFSIDGLLGFDMTGKTVGIVGTGKLGRLTAKILKGFSMDLLAFDPFPDAEFSAETGVAYTSLDTLFSRSDIISLHCPLTPQTKHIIHAGSLMKMKKGVMIVNTGRGGLIDTAALIESLKCAKVGAAGLDVYEEESEFFFEDHSDRVLTDDLLARLLTFPNVLVTSHQGFFTEEAMRNIAATTMGNIQSFFSSKDLPNEICYRCGKDGCRKKETGRCFS